jgi:transcriptional regulator with XRE-family HTH domain
MTPKQQATLDRWEAERVQAMKDLGQRIKAHRLRRGMDKYELAKAWRVSKQSLYAWEAARTMPTTITLQRIALFIGDDDIADLDRYSSETRWRTHELINALIHQGLDQRDLARYAGVSDGAVSVWRLPGSRVKRLPFLKLILLHEELTGSRKW